MDICRYTRRGHCSGCSTTQARKRTFNGLKKPGERAEFVDMIRAQQGSLGRYDQWHTAYTEKCQRLGYGSKV
ncbi:DUF1289 domain-containing protein [Aliiruegeria haliotis]|uniref:DUF1289 domain-containing protein n=1 Tax=Aliiruegeria haliotis TaxID=1280846 RepID=UPI002481B94C|nr:DUF1289 domain-containing protein [Aliiruegeria haliotis]